MNSLADLAQGLRAAPPPPPAAPRRAACKRRPIEQIPFLLPLADEHIGNFRQGVQVGNDIVDAFALNGISELPPGRGPAPGTSNFHRRGINQNFPQNAITDKETRKADVVMYSLLVSSGA